MIKNKIDASTQLVHNITNIDGLWALRPWLLPQSRACCTEEQLHWSHPTSLPYMD